MGVADRLRHAWNAFLSPESWEEPTHVYTEQHTSFGGRPDRQRTSFSNEASIINSILTRLSIDVAGVEIRHARVDEHGRYLETIDSGLDRCLSIEANIDQGGRHFRQDIAMHLFTLGSVAIVPVDTTINPTITGGYDIKSLRTGRVVSWMPEHVRVEVYNEKKGIREEINLQKKFVAIVENPLYSIMNESNSTLQRLIRKLNLLDVVDKQSSSGKLDLIIQLPYAVKSDTRREQASRRRQDIETQMKDSQYGIAWVDATEKITQLNRPAENNLLAQVQYLTEMLYSQLGVTQSVMDGTADEATMLNYERRTIVPILDAISEAMARTFLTQTARTQRQTILYFRDPFALMPLSQIAEVADKFTRNEIVASNEIRQIIGLKPSKDPRADELRNANMPDDKRSDAQKTADTDVGVTINPGDSR